MNLPGRDWKINSKAFFFKDLRMADGYKKRLVVVSNRLPVVVEKKGKEWVISRGSGGLVTALNPVLAEKGGTWIGWPGIPGDLDLRHLLAKVSREAGYSLEGVMLTREDVEKFYHGFANRIIWPLFHDHQDRCSFRPDYWSQYLKVNRKFADKVKACAREGDYIWVHDYHLMHVGSYLKEKASDADVGFFLHIPFPPPDVFLKLPWRREILEALIKYDLIGFQTKGDEENFLGCLSETVPRENIPRNIRTGCFPISIDFEDFASRARSRNVADRAWFFHESVPERQIILGVDRLDYTKGIPQRLEALRLALRRYKGLRGKLILVQVVVPSRSEVPEYKELKAEIERLVGEINGQFTTQGWVPIHYLYRNLGREELLAYYRASEIALITPLRDGMNLVAKEYCAANIDENGVLILSEFAGAAAQLRPEAVIVNPYDLEAVAKAIHRAFNMKKEERKARMRKLREKIRKEDIFWWVDSFLKAALSGKPKTFLPLSTQKNTQSFSA